MYPFVSPRPLLSTIIAPAGPFPCTFTVNLSSPFKVAPSKRAPINVRPNAAVEELHVSCLLCASLTVSVALMAYARIEPL